MSNYKHNTPTFNTDRKVANFNDFVSNLPSELEELKKVKRSFRHEEGEVGNIPNKSKYKYNEVTHKMDDLSKDEVQDKIDAIEEPTNENSNRPFQEWYTENREVLKSEYNEYLANCEMEEIEPEFGFFHEWALKKFELKESRRNGRKYFYKRK